MSTGGLKDVRIVVGVFAATLLITLVTGLIAPAEGPGASGPTSFSSAAAGGKASFLTLRAIGYDVERSFEPMAHLDAIPNETVWLMTGALGPSDQDRRAFRAFVASGGVALVTGPSGATFLDAPGLEKDEPMLPGPVVTHRVIAPSAVTRSVGEITISAPAGRASFGPEYVVLFAQGSDVPLVTTASVGQGRVVWMSAPTPLMNEHLSKADNLQLLLNIIGPPGDRRVIWDEHYHGNTRSLWSYAVKTPLPWMGAQVALIAVCAVLAFGRRWSPVRPRREITRTSPLEFVDMLGALYARSQAGGAAVAVARSRFYRAVTSVCGVSPERGDEAVARAAAARLTVDPERVLAALRASASPTGGTDKTAEHWTSELQAFTRQLYALRKIRQPGTSAPQES